MPEIIIYAVFQTSLSEEIVFRGFLLKRISNTFGFTIGNIVQTVLFGLLHGVLFFWLVGAIKAVLIIVFTGVTAWLMGYINEKKADGCIIPSWIVYVGSNIFSGICATFFAL